MVERAGSNLNDLPGAKNPALRIFGTPVLLHTGFDSKRPPGGTLPGDFVIGL
jgi:hypothetical protein